jgi:hypothetical protein
LDRHSEITECSRRASRRGSADPLRRLPRIGCQVAWLLATIAVAVGGCGSKAHTAPPPVSAPRPPAATPATHAGPANCAAATASCANDALYAALIGQQRSILEQAVNAFQANNYHQGAWDPSEYTTAQGDGWWQKEQWPAITAAVLSADANATGAAVEAKVAADTVNTAIAQHQLPNGAWDEGPQGSTAASVVGGSFWAEAEGIIANVLHDGDRVDAGTLRRWEQSMVSYCSWLENSGEATWYANGNVNINFALVFLATYKLAVDVGDTAFQRRALADYRAEQRFIVNPNRKPAGDWGWHQVGRTGWFSETPPGTGPGNWYCADGQVPCVGLDWEYIEAQLETAAWGYVLSGYDGWWEKIVRYEFNTEHRRLIDGGTIRASGGSRHDGPSLIFYPDVYSIMYRHKISSDPDLWSQQLMALRKQFSATETQPPASLDVNAYTLVADGAVGLLDLEITSRP